MASVIVQIGLFARLDMLTVNGSLDQLYVSSDEDIQASRAHASQYSVSSPAPAAPAQLTARLVMDDPLCASLCKHRLTPSPTRIWEPSKPVPYHKIIPSPASQAAPGQQGGLRAGLTGAISPPSGNGILRLRGSPGSGRGGGHRCPRLLSRGNRHHYSCDLRLSHGESKDAASPPRESRLQHNHVHMVCSPCRIIRLERPGRQREKQHSEMAQSVGTHFLHWGD